MVNLLAAGVSVLLLVRGPGQIWLIWIVMLCYGAASTVIVSAQTALLAVLLLTLVAAGDRRVSLPVPRQRPGADAGHRRRGAVCSCSSPPASPQHP